MRIRKRQSDRRGLAVVELSICLPVLVLIILGTVEISNGIFLRQSLKIMAFEGARITVTPDAVLGDVEHQVNVIAESRGVDVTSISISPSDFSNQPVGTFIEVTVVGASGQAAGMFSNGEFSTSVSIMKNH